MKNRYVTFEVAEGLKKVGFNEDTIDWYFKVNDEALLLTSDHPGQSDTSREEEYNAPFWEIAVEWLNLNYNSQIPTFTGVDYYELREQAIKDAISVILSQQ